MADDPDRERAPAADRPGREQWAVLRTAQGRATADDWTRTTVLLGYQAEIATACEAHDVVVVEKSFAVGMGGQLADNVDGALRNLPVRPRLHSAVAGLGGRPIPRASLHRLFRQAVVQPWEGVHFLDLNERVIGREIHRTGKNRRSGPTAENILKQLAGGRPAEQGRPG